MASKYQQKPCNCNASERTHKHEDDGIFDLKGYKLPDPQIVNAVRIPGQDMPASAFTNVRRGFTPSK